jgi:molybdopterin molybdotransferase
MNPHLESHQHPHDDLESMLTVEQALERVLSLVEQLPAVDVPLSDSDGTTLAKDILAPFNVPALANSAMDGYAVRSLDLPETSVSNPTKLEVIDQIQAGDLPTKSLSHGTAIRIMTGAPIPPGSDSIIPYELTDETDRKHSADDMGFISIRHSASPGDHIRPAGEDISVGAHVLNKGFVLDPPSVGMIASFGHKSVSVIRRPYVAILATGNEVQVPGEVLSIGKLFDSNSYGIGAAIKRWGGIPWYLGVAKDDLDDLREKINEGTKADLLITSAGVSAGAFDMVKEVLSELGTIDFWKVRMRPSRPLAFGLLRSRDGRQVPHLGLPGNPVSALVALIKFGKPSMDKMMGRLPSKLSTVTAILDDPIINSDGRRVFARVTLETRAGVIYAKLTGAQGSNLLTSMVAAHGLAICNENQPRLEVGEKVVVELMDWTTEDFRL